MSTLINIKTICLLAVFCMVVGIGDLLPSMLPNRGLEMNLTADDASVEDYKKMHLVVNDPSLLSKQEYADAVCRVYCYGDPVWSELLANDLVLDNTTCDCERGVAEPYVDTTYQVTYFLNDPESDEFTEVISYDLSGESWIDHATNESLIGKYYNKMYIEPMSGYYSLFVVDRKQLMQNWKVITNDCDILFKYAVELRRCENIIFTNAPFPENKAVEDKLTSLIGNLNLHKEGEYYIVFNNVINRKLGSYYDRPKEYCTRIRWEIVSGPYQFQDGEKVDLNSANIISQTNQSKFGVKNDMTQNDFYHYLTDVRNMKRMRDIEYVVDSLTTNHAQSVSTLVGHALYNDWDILEDAIDVQVIYDEGDPKSAAYNFFDSLELEILGASDLIAKAYTEKIPERDIEGMIKYANHPRELIWFIIIRKSSLPTIIHLIDFESENIIVNKLVRTDFVVVCNDGSEFRRTFAEALKLLCPGEVGDKVVATTSWLERDTERVRERKDEQPIQNIGLHYNYYW